MPPVKGVLMGVVAVLLAGCREQGAGSAPELPVKKPLEEVHKILTGAPKEIPPPVVEDPPAVDEPAPVKDPAEVPAVIPEAAAVPGMPGFVVSPYNGKVIDVREVPVGTLVADPEFAPEERKYFRVPEPIEAVPEVTEDVPDVMEEARESETSEAP